MKKDNVTKDDKASYALLIQRVLASPQFDLPAKIIIIHGILKHKANWTFSNPSISKFTCIHLRSVQRSMKDLVAAEIYVPIGYKHTPTNKYPVYAFKIESLLRLLDKVNDDNMSQFTMYNDDTNSDKTGDLNDDTNGDYMSLYKKDNTNLENTKKKNTKKIVEEPAQNNAQVLSSGNTQGAEGSNPLSKLKKKLGATQLASEASVSSYSKSQRSEATGRPAAKVPLNPFFGFKSGGFAERCVFRGRCLFRNQEFNTLTPADQQSIVEYVAKTFNEPVPEEIQAYLKQLRKA